MTNNNMDIVLNYKYFHFGLKCKRYFYSVKNNDFSKGKMIKVCLENTIFNV